MAIDIPTAIGCYGAIALILGVGFASYRHDVGRSPWGAFIFALWPLVILAAVAWALWYKVRGLPIPEE